MCGVDPLDDNLATSHLSYVNHLWECISQF